MPTVAAVLSATFAVGATLGLFAITSQFIQGLAWTAAATTAAAATVTLGRFAASIWFGLAALLTGYLAVVGLGPPGREEYVYPFAVLRLFPVIGIFYALGFRAIVRQKRLSADAAP